MTASATVLYGWAITEEQLRDEVQRGLMEMYEEYDQTGRAGLASWMLLQDDPSTEINRYGDPVTDLHDATGIWLDQLGEGSVFFLTLRHLVFNQTDYGHRAIALVAPTDKDRELLARHAVGLTASPVTPGWHLVAETF
jgi:hypothetical protein